MRKVLIGILIAILLVIFALMLYQGIKIGNLRLGYSIQEIVNKNDELDTGIAALGSKIETDYKQARLGLDQSFQLLQDEKQKYQDKISYASSEELSFLSETEKYKLDYLWTNIGLYARKNNVTLKLDLSHGSSGIPSQYNISFTTTGDYLSIAEFVYAIEKDPELGFKIEEFALVPYSEEQLQATFIIKNVTIDESSVNQAIATLGTSTTQNNAENTNGENSGSPAQNIANAVQNNSANNSNTNSNNNNSATTVANP